MMELAGLNNLSESSFRAHMEKCCGNAMWAGRMNESRPFSSLLHLFACSDMHWWTLPATEWKVAFLAHPRIGGDIGTLREKFSNTSGHEATEGWEGEEQSGTKLATEETLQALSDGNTSYEGKFGHVFLICATGKSAQEMLDSLQSRISSTPKQELLIAAGEQAKISHIRLNKVLVALNQSPQASRL